MRIPADLPPRIANRIHIDPSSDCWIFTGAPNPKTGYCQIKWGDRAPLIHRVVYELLVGPIPDGLQLDHVKARGCTSRACCNPQHLEPVTARENSLRADGFAAANAAKTHCPQGHLYDEANTRWYRGGRTCRACHRDRYHRLGGGKGGHRIVDPAHCPQGHEYDEANTYHHPNGSRVCRACANEAQQRYRERNFRSPEDARAANRESQRRRRARLRAASAAAEL